MRVRGSRLPCSTRRDSFITRVASMAASVVEGSKGCVWKLVFRFTRGTELSKSEPWETRCLPDLHQSALPVEQIGYLLSNALK